MIEKNLIFGIPVDYKNVFDEFDNSKPVSLKYQNISNILLNENNISEKYIMSSDLNYPHLVGSNLFILHLMKGIQVMTSLHFYLKKIGLRLN